MKIETDEPLDLLGSPKETAIKNQLKRLDVFPSVLNMFYCLGIIKKHLVHIALHASFHSCAGFMVNDDQGTNK